MLYVAMSIYADSCLTQIIIMAFTSGLAHAGSDDGAHIEITALGMTPFKELYNRHGDNYYPHKGDIWYYQMSSFFVIALELEILKK